MQMTFAKGHRGIRAMLSVILMGAALPVYAQANAPSGPQDKAEAQTGGFEEILVTARRREESLDKVPVAASVLDVDALADRTVTNQSDLQTATPGLVVRVATNRDEFNYSLRGQTIDISSGSQPAVLSYVNEVPVTALSQSSLFDLSSVQVLKGPQGTLFGRNTTGGAVLFTTARPDTEAVSGFGLARAGNYDWVQIQGALNLPVTDTLAIRLAGDFIRRDGYIRNRLTGRDLNDDRRESGRVSVLWNPTPNLSNLTVVEFARGHGNGSGTQAYVANAPGSVGPPPLNQPLVATAAIFYSPVLDTILGAGAYAKLQASFPGLPNGGITQYVAEQRKDPLTVSLDANLFHYLRSTFASNTTTLDVSDTVQIKNIFGFNWNHKIDGVDPDGTPFPLIINAEYERQSRGYSDELQLSGKALDDQLDFIVGGFWAKEQLTSPTRYGAYNFGPALNPLVAPIFGLPSLPVAGLNTGTRRSEGKAIYAQVTYRFAGVEGLSATVGGRYSWEHLGLTASNGREFDAHESKPSWQVGLQYETGDLMVYAVSRGSWRTGGFNLDAPGVPGDASVGGNSLEPETTEDVEIGAKYNGSIGAVPLRLNIALYKQWVHDVQRAAFVSLPTGLGAVTYNVPGGTRFQGLELQGEIQPASWLSLGGSFAVTDGRYGDPHSVTLFGSFINFDTLADVAKYSGSAYFDASMPLQGDGEKVSLRGDLYAQSKTYFSNYALSSNPGAVVPGYALANFRLEWSKVQGSGISAAAFLKNAFDKRYYLGGVGQSLQFGLSNASVGEPRMYGVELKVEF